MGTSARRLLDAMTRHHAAQFAPPAQYDLVTLTAIQTTSTGSPTVGTATVDGAGAFGVDLRGKAASEGETWLARRTGGALGAEYELWLPVASDNPGAGFLLIDANIPYPDFAAAAATALSPSGGAILATLTVFVAPVDEGCRPSRYKVAWRVTGSGATWQDLFVNHIPGATSIPCNLPLLQPGTQVDVKLATLVNYAQRSSDDSPPATYTAASDNVSPATLTAVAVSADTPGQLVIKPQWSALNPIYFQDWEVSIATSAGGAGAQTFWFRSDTFTFVGTVGVGYYVALKARAKNGMYGNRIPATPTQWQGPYHYTGYALPPDTTPPPDWAAPIVTLTRNSPANGGEQALLTVTLPTSPAYPYPADYKQTIVRGQSAAGFVDVVIPNGGTATPPMVVPFGTWIVNLIGEDTNGNRSGASPSTSVSLAPTGVPGPAPDVTTASGSEAVIIRWTAATDALRYKVWRATDAAGTGAAVIATTDGSLWPDLFQGNGVVGQTYYYKVQGVNIQGDGTISPTWKPGTVGAVDGRNLVVNSVVADRLESNLVLGTTIRTPDIGFGYVALVGTTGNAYLLAVNHSNVVTMRLSGDALAFFYAASGRKSAEFNASGIDFLQDAPFALKRATYRTDGLRIYQDDGVTARVQLLNSGLYVDAATGSVDDRMWFYDAGAAGVTLNNRVVALDHGQLLFRYDAPALAGVTNQIALQLDAIGNKYFRLVRNSTNELGLTPSQAGMALNIGATQFMATDVFLARKAASQWVVYGASGAGAGIITLRADSFPQVAFGVGGTEDTYLFRSGSGVLDVEPNLRVSRSNTYAFKISAPSASLSTEFNWSHFSLYMGWTTNPGAAVNVGNGAGNFGPIYASAFTVSSGRRNKEAIRAWARKGAIDGLRAARFRRKGSAREEVGFVAEEVERHLPEAVETRTMRHPTPDGEDGPEVEEKFVNPMALLAELWEEVRALRQEVATLKGAQA